MKIETEMAATRGQAQEISSRYPMRWSNSSAPGSYSSCTFQILMAKISLSKLIYSI